MVIVCCVFVVWFVCLFVCWLLLLLLLLLLLCIIFFIYLYLFKGVLGLQKHNTYAFNNTANYNNIN